jgi:hypothetical protein
MQIGWIDTVGLLVLAWILLDRLRKLEAENRRLEIQNNTNEMNIKKLYFFRDIESYELNGALSEEDRQAFKAELDGANQQLSERNKLLMAQTNKKS